MKILFITAPLYDYLADSLLIGFRELYGTDCVDYPRKPMMYGEFPTVYGRGFTIWSRPIQDIRRNEENFTDIDLVIYSNYRRQKPVDWRVLVRNKNQAPRIVYVDGNDDGEVESGVRPFFKRELLQPCEGVFPIGFGIPGWLVRPLAPDLKSQLHQTHIQDPDFTSETAYKFTEEKEYYDDLARSFFGITMRKGGWDCMRHYEIMAAGTVVMFKNFDAKPPLCAPHCPHFISYSDKRDFLEKTGRLLTDGKPNTEYVRILQAQRDWLLENATCTARAGQLLLQIENYFAGRPREKMPVVRFKTVRLATIHLFLLMENAKLWAITFVKQNPLMDWFYYEVFKKIPGVAWFVSRVLMKEPPPP